MSDSIYEEQLSAAKFRAERDQARQDACVAKVKLGRAMKELGEAKREVEKLRGDALRSFIVGQSMDNIEREIKLGINSIAELLEIGGEIQELPIAEVCPRIVAEMEPRLMPKGYEWSDGFSGAVDFFEAMHDLLYTIDGEERTGPEMVRDVMARLLPKGMEWPRYENGEPVQFGDETNLTDSVESITFSADGTTLIGDKHGDFDAKYVQCVKRPQDSAADDDGCCEPGTYRCQEAAFTCDSCGHTVFVDKCMVDEVRYLRAKGIRTLNCCCGHGGKVEPFIIVNEGDECRMLNMGYERHVNEHGVTYFMPKSSCRPKGLANTKPEPPDTWGLIWTSVTTGTTTLHEFERRCKALAEKENGNE